MSTSLRSPATGPEKALEQAVPRTASRGPNRPRLRRQSSSALAPRTALTAVMWLIALAFAFPLLWFALSSFKPGSELFTYPLSMFPKDPTATGYVDAWTRLDFARFFGNTVFVSIVTTVLTVFVSACTGYALAKYDARWVRVFFICILATTMLPTEVILTPTFSVIRDLGLYNSLAGVIIPSIVTATGIFMFRQFFVTVPNELIESARIDGASELGIFFRIMLPLSTPIIATLAIFSFQWRWNDYIWPLIVLSDPDKYTIQVALRSIVGAENIDWPLLLSASMISILPLVAVYLVFQRYVMNTDINSGLKE